MVSKHERIFYLMKNSLISVSVFIQRMPFDSENPIGFMATIIIQYTAVSYLFHVIGSVISLAIGAFIFAIASTKEIKTNINDFNNVVNAGTTSDNHAYLMSQFNVFVHAHSTIKQLSKFFNSMLFVHRSNFEHITFVILELRQIFRMYFNQYLWFCFRGQSLLSAA